MIYEDNIRHNCYYVYILSSRTKVLYVGMTNHLARRIYEHKNKINEGFTAKYNADKLVYFEEVENETSAKKLEKQIKGWLRKRKINLIESKNPNWDDLSSRWMDSLLGKKRS